MIVRVAEKLGGMNYIRDVQSEIYKLMLERFGIDLKRRLTNKRLRAADEGMCRSKRDKLSYLDVIAEDKRAIEGYVQLVKERQKRQQEMFTSGAFREESTSGSAADRQPKAE